VTPEILIVGDAVQRRDLIHSVRDRRYDVTLCQPNELSERIRTGPEPAAIVVCIADVDPGPLLAGLRRSREGAAIPVVLHGSLGGEIQDLADVLDLGADHFIADPVQNDLLAEVLLELAGPASPETEIGNRGPSITYQQGGTRGGREERLRPEFEDRDQVRHGSSSSGRRTAPRGDHGAPALGNLHQTLDRLEARLRDSDRDSGIENDEFSAPHESMDLESLRLGDIPDVDGALEPDETVDPADSSLGLRVTTERETSVLHAPSEAMALEVKPLSIPALQLSQTKKVGHEREATENLGRAEGLGRGSGRQYQPSPSPEEPRPPSDFAAGELPGLLWGLHEAEYFGSLELSCEDAEIRLWLEDGEVVGVDALEGGDEIEDLVQGLLARGMLTRAQAEEAQGWVEDDSREGGSLLIEAGFLKASEWASFHQDRLGETIDSSFSWPSGEYSLKKSEAMSDEIVRLERSMTAVILEGVRNGMGLRDTRDLLAGSADGDFGCPRLIRPGHSKRSVVAECIECWRLEGDEERWVRQFDGEHSVGDLLDRDDDETRLLSLVYALKTCGFLTLGSTKAKDADNGVPCGEDPVKIDGQRIFDRLSLARESDYFEFLGLQRDADRTEIRSAHARLCATFSNVKLEEQSAECWASDLTELRAALDDARDVLLDDPMRSAYLAQLEEP